VRTASKIRQQLGGSAAAGTAAAAAAMAEERPARAFPDGEFTAAELKGIYQPYAMLFIQCFCSVRIAGSND
jgi:hypothetical protein